MFSNHLSGVLVAVCLGLLASVEGHGRLLVPPSRSSMWRAGFKTPKNYNDNQLFCGGMSHQWNKMNGKCGICGDPYDGVRENEAGGIYGTGTIGKYYKVGQLITVDVELTANHLGWFEFRLCVNNNVNKRATQECLDKHLLELADGSGTRLHIGSRKGHYFIKLRLPIGVTCDQCVFQWKYHTGNTWGVNMVNRCKGLGCSEPQEEFYGCADVAIQSKLTYGRSTLGPRRHTTRKHSTGKPRHTTRKHSTGKPRHTTRKHSTGKPRHTTRKPFRHSTRKPRHTTPKYPHHRSSTSRTHRFCRAIGKWTGNFRQDVWCRKNCRLGNCPRSICKCN